MLEWPRRESVFGFVVGPLEAKATGKVKKREVLLGSHELQFSEKFTNNEYKPAGKPAGTASKKKKAKAAPKKKAAKKRRASSSASSYASLAKKKKAADSTKSLFEYEPSSTSTGKPAGAASAAASAAAASAAVPAAAADFGEGSVGGALSDHDLLNFDHFEWHRDFDQLHPDALMSILGPPEFNYLNGGGKNAVCITKRMTDPYGVLLRALQSARSRSFPTYIWVEDGIPDVSSLLPKDAVPLTIGENGRYCRATELTKKYNDLSRTGEKPAYTFGQYLFNCPHHNLKVPRLPPLNTTYHVYLGDEHYFDLTQTNLKNPSTEQRFNFYGLFAARPFVEGEIVTMYDGYLFTQDIHAGYDTLGDKTLPRATKVDVGVRKSGRAAKNCLDAQTRDAQLRPIDNPDMAECFGFAQFMNHAGNSEGASSSSAASSAAASSVYANCEITNHGGIKALRDIIENEELFIDYGKDYAFSNEAERDRRVVGWNRMEPIRPKELTTQLWNGHDETTEERLDKFQPNNWKMKVTTGSAATVPYSTFYASVTFQPSGSSSSHGATAEKTVVV